jgi:hypothetical protein
VFDFLLLRVMAGLSPDAAIQVKLRPVGGEHFAFPASGDDQQAYRVGGGLIGIGSERGFQALQLGKAQPSFALVFLVSRNSAGRIHVCHLPVNRQGKHRAEQ